MELLTAIAVCTGLFILFPKAFKFWVGSFVGTAGGIFFWSIGFFIYWMIAGLPSWVGMGWSALAFVILGNVVGLYCAAKG
jgi:hypothetical protein